MSWTRLDDKWDASEKLEAAAEVLKKHGDSAYAMWSRAVTFCNGALTDGRIRGAKLRSLTKHPKPAEVVAALVASGAIEDDGGDWYQVHDFLDWNDSREVVEARRAGKREAASKGGKTTADRRHVGAPSAHQTSTKSAAPCLTPAAPTEHQPGVHSSPLLSSPSGPSDTEIPPTPQGGKPVGSVAVPGAKRRGRQPEPRTLCPPVDASPADVEAWLVRWDIPPVKHPVWGATVQNLLNRNRANPGKGYSNWTAAWMTSAGNAVQWGHAHGNPEHCRRSKLGAAVQREAVTIDHAEDDRPIPPVRPFLAARQAELEAEGWEPPPMPAGADAQAEVLLSLFSEGKTGTDS